MNLLFYVSFVAIFLTEYLDHTGNVGIFVGAIIGGAEAYIKNYPYHVLVQAEFREGSTTKIKRCGGCVISKNKFLTAAQCVKNSEGSVMVWCGSAKLNYFGSGKYAMPYGIRRNIEQDHIIVHPNYTEPTSGYDLAVLIVNFDRKIPICDGINKIDMIRYNYNFEEGTMLTVTGFGGIEYTRDPRNVKYPNELQYIDFPLIKPDECARNYAGRYANFSVDRMFCAGFYNNEKRTSFGDVGGPVVDKERNVLVGIVSWSESELPVVMTKISEFREWIKATKFISKHEREEEQRKRENEGRKQRKPREADASSSSSYSRNNGEYIESFKKWCEGD